MNGLNRTVFYMIFFVLLLKVFSVEKSFSIMALMSDDDLSNIDAQVSEIRIVTHNTPNDTVRMYFDIHQEIYGKIDSLKLGYYYADSSELATTPIEIGLSGFEGYYHGADGVNNGANFGFFKITSDFNTMAPANGASLEPWGNGGFNQDRPEKTLTKNCNNFDWDLWIDNLQLGESPDKPQEMNGMIVRMEFNDSIYSASPKLQRLIIGTNDLQGNTYYNAHRMSGVTNPLVLTATASRSAGAKDPYSYIAGAMGLKRDVLGQCFAVGIMNVEDRDTGAWFVLDFDNDYLKFSVNAGVPENGNDFNYITTNGLMGYEGVELWDPGWAPNGNSSGMAGSDPYATHRQEEYVSGY